MGAYGVRPIGSHVLMMNVSSYALRPEVMQTADIFFEH